MTETTDREKENFLAWYENATDEDKVKARQYNNDKYRELIARYKTEIEEINLRKGILNMQRATYGLPLTCYRTTILT